MTQATAATPATTTPAAGIATTGAGTNTGAADDAAAVRAVVQEAMTTKDPGACTRLMTAAFRRQNTAEHDNAAAIKSCRGQADEPGATSLSIDRVAVSGTRAAADISPSGGNLPFKTAKLGLRKAGGRWKLDRLKGGTLDRSALRALMHRDLVTSSSGLKAADIDCAVDALDDDDAVVRAFVKADQAVILVPVELCVARAQMSRAGAPAPFVDCFIKGMRREMTSGPLSRRLGADPTAALRALQSPAGVALGKRLGLACRGSVAPVTG